MPTSNPLDSTSSRQRAVAFALALAENTSLQPAEWEHTLLQLFIAGELSLDELEARLESALQILPAAKQ